jgi:hypothetical protein
VETTAESGDAVLAIQAVEHIGTRQA